MPDSSSVYKLETLIKLFETLSFSNAAFELGISQAAVSQHIKDLEDGFGVTLVNRNQRPLKPTEAGELLAKYGREILGMLVEMERRVAGLRDGKTGNIVIGASTSVGSYLLPNLVARFRTHYPKVEITARISPRARVYEDLKSGKTDFAFVLATESPPDLSYDPLRVEQLVFVCSPEHSLAAKRHVTLSSVRKEGFVTAGQKTDYVLMSNDILCQHGINGYDIAIELDSMEAVKRAVSLNMGIGFLPLLGVEKEIRNGEIYRIRLTEPTFQCELALVYRSEKFLTPTMSTAISFFRHAVTRGHESKEPLKRA